MIQIRQTNHVIFHTFLIKNTLIGFKITLQYGANQTMWTNYNPYISFTNYTIFNFLIFTTS